MYTFLSNCLTGLSVLLSLGSLIGGIIVYIIGYSQPQYCEANKYYDEGTGYYTPDEIQKMYDICMGNAYMKERNGIILICLGCFGLILYCIIALIIRYRKGQHQSRINNQRILNEITVV